jgi:hypothetical protein
MTIVCAYTDGQTTWLGSDTAGVADMGNSLYCEDVGGKWIMRAGWAFGAVGDNLFSVMLSEQAPEFFDDLSASSEPAALFARRLRALFADYQFKATYKDDAVPNWQNSGILATAGRFWDFEGTTAYTLKPINAFFARGCAMPLALGAAYGRQAGTPGTKPETLIDTALAAAEHFDMQIRGRWQGRLDGTGRGGGHAQRLRARASRHSLKVIKRGRR